jgi:hypothetical protein
MASATEKWMAGTGVKPAESVAIHHADPLILFILNDGQNDTIGQESRNEFAPRSPTVIGVTLQTGSFASLPFGQVCPYTRCLVGEDNPIVENTVKFFYDKRSDFADSRLECDGQKNLSQFSIFLCRIS